MVTKIRLSVALALQLLCLFVVANLLAQVDPAKVLVGVWEGQAQTPAYRERTLVVTSVKATRDGEWVGRGRFGITGQVDTAKAGGPMEINISSKNNEIYAEWVQTNDNIPVHVKMVGDNKLEGTIGVVDRSGRLQNRKITFEKVKAGEVQ